MFVPIILGSDKTTVSVATGDNEYYPLYLSIGNIRNNVRRAHRNGVALVGFLSVPKSMYIYHNYSTILLIRYGSGKTVYEGPTFSQIQASIVSHIADQDIAIAQAWDDNSRGCPVP
jgi:hypothetical protein